MLGGILPHIGVCGPELECFVKYCTATEENMVLTTECCSPTILSTEAQVSMLRV